MPALRNRRGSTIVLVALMLVAFMAVGAIAADIGRFYVVTGELQTASDAAALAGAQVLQSTPGTTPEPAVDAAVVAFVAATNKADNRNLTVDPAAVVMGYWDPDSGKVLPLAGRRPNAVTVTLGAEARGTFGQVIGYSGQIMSRPATAWIANLGANCVRPWAFQYLPLYKAVSGNAAATDVAPDLDPAQFIAYEQTDSLSRMFTMLGPTQVTTKAVDGSWYGFNYGGNAGKPDFQGGILGCTNYPISADAGNGKTLPGQGGQYNGWSTDAIVNGDKKNGTPPLCTFKANDAGCYSSATASVPGVKINVAWGDAIGTGSSTINFRYVGEFVMKCYYSGSATAACPYAKSGAPTTGYPEGTIVGYMTAIKSRIITPEDIFGNKASNVQRLILVK